MRKSKLYARRDLITQAGAWGFWALAMGGLSSCAQASDSAKETSPLTTIHAGRLAIASDLIYPPLVLNQEGKEVGFGVGVCDDLAQGFDLSVDPVECGDSQEVFRILLEGGTADLGATALNASSLPSGLIMGHEVLPVMASVVVHPSTSPRNVEELNNPAYQVIVQDHPAIQQWASEHLSGPTIEYLADPQAILSAVREGRVQAAVLEQVVALYYLATVYTHLDIAFSSLTPNAYTFIAPAQSQELARRVDEELQRLKNDGVIDSLESRWFGEVISVPQDAQ